MIHWVGGKLEVDVMTQRLDNLNVNVVNSSAPPPCEICDFLEHLTLNCHIGSPFAQNTSEVNYVNNFNPNRALTHILIPII